MNKKMKYSGVDWIGEIPEDWEVIRLKNVLKERNENNKGIKTRNILSLTNDRGVIPYEEKGEVGNKAKENYEDYKLAYPNDIVLNSMNITIGSVGLSKYYGCVSPVYYMLNIRNFNDNIKYYNYLFQTKEMQSKLRGYGNGIMEIRLRIQMLKLNTILLPIPSHKTQNLIVAILDKKCSQIDNLITNQQQQIEKLKQYKQSLITEVVTKGLDSNVPMKDSGVEWIGEIPEDWEINRIKYICEFNPSSKKLINSEDEISYAPMECIKNGYMIKKEIKYKKLVSGLTYFEENDILMAKVTPCFENGNIAIATDLKNNIGYGSSELFVFRAFYVNTKWLFYFLRNNKFNKLAKATMTGTGGLKRVSVNFVKNLFLAIPKIEEQEKIANYLDEKCSQIDKLINIKEKKIEKLNEYKKSLIYEYVTGKKEV